MMLLVKLQETALLVQQQQVTLRGKTKKMAQQQAHPMMAKNKAQKTLPTFAHLVVCQYAKCLSDFDGELLYRQEHHMIWVQLLSDIQLDSTFQQVNERGQSRLT